MRFNPAIAQLLDELAAGVIGTPMTMQASFGYAFPPNSNIWRPELGGGALLDLGIYPLTLAQLISAASTKSLQSGTCAPTA